MVTTPTLPSRRRTTAVPWAWIVAGASLLVLVSSSGFRALPGVVMDPMHAELGWSHTSISLAVSVNLVFFGLTAPFSAALMEHYSIRRVVTGSLLLMSLGSALPALVTSQWMLVASWGLLVGIGGGSVALAYVASLTNRWFIKHRGLVTGVLTAGGTAGQLVFLPLLAWLATRFGWQTASLIAAGAAAMAAPAAFWLIRDHPRDVGQSAYGADELTEAELRAATVSEPEVAPPSSALRVLGQAVHTKAFWLLMTSFAICGITTAGIVQTHFIPAAHDHGMLQTTAAGLLALAGVFDVVGTMVSGWLTDRIDSRLLLGAYYLLRGISLLFLPSLFTSDITTSMLAFTIFYGLDWIATVPPTIRLCQECFGPAGSIVFGWLWAAHQIGGALAAGAGGVIRDQLGDYALAWYAGGLLCVCAALLSLLIPRMAAAGYGHDRDSSP